MEGRKGFLSDDNSSTEIVYHIEPCDCGIPHSFASFSRAEEDRTQAMSRLLAFFSEPGAEAADGITIGTCDILFSGSWDG
jgi:hypothetical protein